MNQEQKRHHWALILEQQQNSNLTIKQFCLDNDINYQTFHYWFKKLNKPEVQTQVQPIVVTESYVDHTSMVARIQTAKCDTLQYQAATAISLKIIAGCLKSKHFFGR